jgi:hypothetical protein
MNIILTSKKMSSVLLISFSTHFFSVPIRLE